MYSHVMEKCTSVGYSNSGSNMHVVRTTLVGSCTHDDGTTCQKPQLFRMREEEERG